MCVQDCYIIINFDRKKMPKIVLNYTLTQSTMQPRLLVCIPSCSRSVPYTPKLEAGEGSHTITCLLNMLPKIDKVQLGSMAPEVTEHCSFLKLQLAATFPYSHLLPCVYFIFMLMIAELPSQPVQSCNYCFQKNAHDNYYINN